MSEKNKGRRKRAETIYQHERFANDVGRTQSQFKNYEANHHFLV
jgi:hypothetical protein